MLRLAVRFARAGGLAVPALALTVLCGTPRAAAAEGLSLGRFRLTYYYVAQEDDVGPRPLHGKGCAEVLAYTSSAFVLELSREGTGRLRDGRLLNFAERCGCAEPGHGGERLCYEVLNPAEYPWGKGARLGPRHHALRPLRSLAVDPSVVPLGTILYLPAWRGRRGPDGKLLDGCFTAGDSGLLVRGRSLDLFAGPRHWAGWLERTYRISSVVVYRDVPRCRAPGGD
jgi:3D (Asp-Asp-Asp) domain-containing protein